MFKFRRMWRIVFLFACHFANNASSMYTSNEDYDEAYTVLNLLDGVNMTTTQDIFNNGIRDEEERFIRILIFEGPEFRTAVTNVKKHWENGVVPYEISDDYNEADKKVIMSAISDFRTRTCVRFRPRKTESSYIFIMPGSGCSAIIGKVPDVKNKVTLGTNCVVKGIVIHELMHALGFVHEQNRPDRDEFVTINFDNIKEGAQRNFDKRSPDQVQSFNQTYDYESVMHYGAFYFAKNKREPTIIPLTKGVKIGQRKGFSDKDIIKINLLYNCTVTNNTANETDTDYEVKEESDKDTERRRQYKKLKSLLRKFFRF